MSGPADQLPCVVEFARVTKRFNDLTVIRDVTFSVLAWVNVFRAESAAHGEWNPAGAQLIWGRALSALGVLVSMLLAVFFVCVILKLFPWQQN